MSSKKLLVVCKNSSILFFQIVKAQLEELKNQKKVHEPILTAEEKASAINEAEIKGTGF